MSGSNPQAEGQKRLHIPSGTTPNKPEGKKVRSSVENVRSKKTLFPSQKTPFRRTNVSSPLKQLRFSPNPSKKQATSWQIKEIRALVEYIALFPCEPSSSDSLVIHCQWPKYGENHPYWTEMANYIKDTSRSLALRSARAVRKQVFLLKKTHGTVEAAEEHFGLTVEGYLEGMENIGVQGQGESEKKLSGEIRERIKRMPRMEVEEAVLEGLQCLENVSGKVLDALLKKVELKDVVSALIEKMEEKEKEVLLDDVYLRVAQANGIDSNPSDFACLSINAMKKLQAVGKNNLLYKFAQCIAVERPDKSGPLMLLNRMPFGMVEYCIEFFSCTNSDQISVPNDYDLWLETMRTEFPGRFQKLFAGPMWSGLNSADIKNPLKARTNVPCTSKMAQNRKNKKSPFSSSTGVQGALLDELKEVNPSGRFWIKLDATDCKEALMESQRGEWNGDVNLGNGELAGLRDVYDKRHQKVQNCSKASNYHDLQQYIRSVVDDLDEDKNFLSVGLTSAIESYRKKFGASNTPEESLKGANWNVVEFQTLLEQCQAFKVKYEEHLRLLEPSTVSPAVFHRCRAVVKDLVATVKIYLRNLFKKKRTAATHVLVLMIADEQRNKKPYALPVRYIPCRTLRDQFVRDLTRELKVEMKKRNLLYVGTVTDGEFCSLRTRGERRALHLWQLIHDAREAVQKMSVNNLLQMLVTVNVLPDGSHATARPHPAIPQSLIQEIHILKSDGMPMEDVVTYVRGKLVPRGYSPFPFRRNVPVESFKDKLQSIVATCIFRNQIKELQSEGVDFGSHVYVPETDTISGVERHDRADHNHVYKRMAKHVRDGGYQQLNYEAFDDVLKDSKSGLTHAALIGKRKQSLVDAERLLSYHVVDSLRLHGHEREAEHVEIMVHWHDATDGRGLSQLTRCKYNYKMLTYILDEWMPWHNENYDFSTIDINRPVENIRGFSRETVIEVTANIESQEFRRRQNSIIGYTEHPRAGGTDDLETFFSITHRDLGPVFTLKQFKTYWPNNVREFSKRIDVGLPFYYCTSNERFRDEELPSFDEKPAYDDDVQLRNHPLRLRRLRINQREDSSIFVSARSVLPARHKKSIRQAFHKPEEILPNPLPH